MRLCVVSDTHRHRHELLQVVKAAQPLAAVLHAGDETSDVGWLQARVDWPVIGVAGNWDNVTAEFPAERTLHQFGPTILLVHGHLFHVKENLKQLVHRAEEQSAQIIIFGHTHHAVSVVEDGKLLLNPGSLAQPRGRTERTFAILDIDEQDESLVRVSHVTLHGTTVSDLTVQLDRPVK